MKEKPCNTKKIFLREIITLSYLLIALVLMSCNTTSKEAAPSITLSVADPLPSWNEGEVKNSITAFVKKVTDSTSTDFIPVNDRIATFDNDGTLWSEQPLYFQFFFVIDRVKALAPQHPEWKTKEPFKSMLAGDIKKALASGEKGIGALMIATHAGMTDDEFDAIVKEWVKNGKHPKTKKGFTEMVYQPMLELMEYLRAHGFKTYIVSGGGIDFMRPWAEEVYGIPPQQVVGSSLKVKYEVKGDKPVITRLPEVDFIDDKAGKPVGIHQHIGKRPVFAAGNSDGDYEMLQYTTTGGGARFGIIVHHTDSVREWAYDRKSPIGNLEKGLDDAPKYGWVLVDMKRDWKKIYP
jgi:phosphoglycolate phosphatase-like HAD superfamily hydrolase